MCGFVGIAWKERERPVPEALLRQMLVTIRHRGPDGDGFHCEPGVGLGFARLAIIDPEGGDQPLANEDGSVWVAFNGEIYNFRELAAELQAHGHTFRTRSDTETIVHAYEQWGDAFVDRLRGIFAFALWDRGGRRLLLVRDRSGIKPLLMASTADGIVFGSEAKAILASGLVARGLDLLGYLGGDSVEPEIERTSFAGIHQVGAGCMAIVRDGQLTTRRYWRYAPNTAGAGSKPDRVEQFRELFHETVGMQLVSDVPIAASLSGGVDSSAVVASIVRHGRADIRAYTVAFDHDHTRDLANSRVVAKHLGIHHVEVPCHIGPETSDQVFEIAWHAEGEFDLGYLARCALARAVSADGAKVLLTGQGIDEILTGYYPSYAMFRRAGFVQDLKSRIQPSYRGLPAFGLRVVEQVAEDLYPSLDAWAVLSTARLRAEHARLSSGLLRFEDRMGMAGHVEVRVPMLDHRLLELCCDFTEQERVRWFDRKTVLRSAAAPWLPESIANRPKVGFNVSSLPLSRLVTTAGMETRAGALLSRETTEQKGYFDAGYRDELFAARDFASLDHVLIVHLLDELFVSGLEFKRIDPTVETVVVAASTEDPRPPVVQISSVPSLSPSVVRLTGTWVAPVEGASEARFRGTVEFAEVARAPMEISGDALEVLRRVDGQMTCGAIASAAGVSESSVLSIVSSFTDQGVLVTKERP